MNGFIKHIVTTVKKILRRLRDDNISEYSAYSALFMILSFLPFTILLLGIVGSLGLSENIRFSGLYVLSDDITGLIKKLLREAEDNRLNLISIGTVTALWSSARGLTGIINGLDRIHNSRTGHGSIIARIRAALYTAVFAAIVIVTLVVLVFGRLILEKTASLLPDGLIVSDAPVLRWAAVFVVLTVFFLFIFTATPKQKSTVPKKLPGAIFSAAGWIIFSAIYSVYVRYFAVHSVLYGSLTVIVMLILWIYFCMYLLFLGEELNIRLEERTAGRQKENNNDRHI